MAQSQNNTSPLVTLIFLLVVFGCVYVYASAAAAFARWCRYTSLFPFLFALAFTAISAEMFNYVTGTGKPGDSGYYVGIIWGVNTLFGMILLVYSMAAALYYSSSDKGKTSMATFREQYRDENPSGGFLRGGYETALPFWITFTLISSFSYSTATWYGEALSVLWYLSLILGFFMPFLGFIEYSAEASISRVKDEAKRVMG